MKDIYLKPQSTELKMKGIQRNLVEYELTLIGNERNSIDITVVVTANLSIFQ